MESVFLLALGLAFFGLYHCFCPSGHALNQVSTNLLSVLSYSTSICPQSSCTPAGGTSNALSCHLRCCHRCSIGEVRWLCRPLQDIDLALLAPLWGILRGVFGVIILLKVEIFPGQPIKLHHSQEFTLTNAGVQLSIHSPIYLAPMTHSLRGHAAPN